MYSLIHLKKQEQKYELNGQAAPEVYDYILNQISLVEGSEPILCHWTLLMPPGNIRKPKLKWKETSGMKWVVTERLTPFQKYFLQ